MWYRKSDTLILLAALWLLKGGYEDHYIPYIPEIAHPACFVWLTTSIVDRGFTGFHLIQVIEKSSIGDCFTSTK